VKRRRREEGKKGNRRSTAAYFNLRISVVKFLVSAPIQSHIPHTHSLLQSDKERKRNTIFPLSLSLSLSLSLCSKTAEMRSSSTSSSSVSFLCLLLVCSVCVSEVVATSYFYSVTGSDSADGTSAETAWKSLNHSVSLNPGLCTPGPCRDCARCASEERGKEG
jgi:hypothetical protein